MTYGVGNWYLAFVSGLKTLGRTVALRVDLSSCRRCSTEGCGNDVLSLSRGADYTFRCSPPPNGSSWTRRTFRWKIL